MFLGLIPIMRSIGAGMQVGIARNSPKKFMKLHKSYKPLTHFRLA